MTELSHNTLKQLMVNILQADTTVFDINGNGKFTYIEVGEPPGNPLPITPTFPGMWITNSRPLETIKHSGTDVPAGRQILNHDVDYELKMMVNEQDSIVAEKKLDDLQKIVMESLEANDRFFVPWDNSNDYLIGEVVTLADGKAYVSLQTPNLNQNPATQTAFWKFDTRVPNISSPSRVDTFRQNLDGQSVRGKSITWRCLFTT